MESWMIKKFREATEPSLDDLGDVGDFEEPVYSFDEGYRLWQAYGTPIHVTYFETFIEAMGSEHPEIWEETAWDGGRRPELAGILTQFYRSHSFGYLSFVKVRGDIIRVNRGDVYDMNDKFKYIVICKIDDDPYSFLFNDLRMLECVDFD